MTFYEWLNGRLRFHGAYDGVVDDVPGRAMIEALKRFQKSQNLKVTGLADAATVSALRSLVTTTPAVPVMPTEPVWMTEARRFMGLKEIAGAKSNSTIIGWAKRLGGWIKSFYTNDDIPWCGLFIAHVVSFTLPEERLPANPLSALAWGKFGLKMKDPAPGAIMVFKRPGGGHVGLYVGEDKLGRYHILGGNQSNSVSIAPIDKDRLVAIRWPDTGGPVPAGRRVILQPNGKTSTNEA